MERDEAARLAEKFGPAVYRLALAKTGNRADAEDVTQEVFLRLLSARPALRDDEHAKAWLFRVTSQRSVDHFRRLARRREVALEEASTLAAEGEEAGRAWGAVLTLPSIYREVIHLFYYEELTVAQIAAVVGRSEGAVKTRLSRGRALLRQRLGEEDEDLV